MDKTQQFLKIFKKARAKYIGSEQRLAAEGWGKDWHVLIATIMSAQSRDTTTIPIAEKLFRKYRTLKDLANASYKGVLTIFKSLNYNRTKAKHVIEAARFILSEFKGKLPDTLDELTRIPGVGRKTANIVLVEVFNKDALPTDTHVHRISNVLGLVKTKTPEQTEFALKKIVPRKYWTDVNNIFVRWGQNNASRDRKKLLSSLQ